MKKQAILSKLRESKPQLSLASSPIYASLIVIISLGLFTGIFWAFSEYQAYSESVSNIRDNYQERYRKRVVEEIDRVVDFIEYKKSQQASIIEKEIRDKVQSAYSIASHVNSLYKNVIPLEELRHMVVELLRPIRWDSGLGYYFAGRVSSGEIDLFADKPQLEGINLLKVEDENLRSVTASLINIIKEKGAGQLQYNWSKPEAHGSLYPKMTFVKHFPPFDWFIGAGIYIDEMESRIQSDILDRLSRLHYGMGGQVMVFRLDGTILLSHDKNLRGRSVTTLVDDNQSYFGQDMLNIALSGKESGFVVFTKYDKKAGKPAKELGFIKKYSRWDWVIVTTISMVEMEKAIESETAAYRKIAFKNTFLFIILLLIAVSALLFLAYFYSLKIKSGIDQFTEFFRQSADSKVRLEMTELSFREFEILGTYANRMNEDRLAKEQVIARDELRLDTLLQLGIMEGHSFKTIYDFTLKRVAEITESDAGYFLKIEKGTPLLQSQTAKIDGDWRIIEKKEPKNENYYRYDYLLKKVIQHKKTVVANTAKGLAWQTFFPVQGEISRRIDVPVIENGEIVCVLGLCNKREEYGEDDKRHITLLLEGMWLHIARISDRKERIRLRMLLKNITDSMPSILIGIDKDQRVTQWNLLAQKKTGISPAEAEGKLIEEVFPEIQHYKDTIVKVIETGEQAEVQRIPVVVENETLYESLTVYPLEFEGTRGAVLRIDDVSDWVAMEEMMIQSEKMLTVGGLAAGIAHEINNPLASVIQNLQVVQKRLSSASSRNVKVADELGVNLDDIKKYFKARGIGKMMDLVRQDSARAAKLVHNMLSFSRKSASVFIPVDIRDLLDRALELGLADYDLRKNYDFRQICVNKEYDSNIDNVICEETNIQQVFLNIIRNAAHALAENRENITEPCLTLRVISDGDMAQVEIEDNGIGISTEVRKKIFEPFFTTKGVGKGTGLGLSISYYIICDQHKGSLNTTSVWGKGSVFIIRLPFVQSLSEAS